MGRGVKSVLIFGTFDGIHEGHRDMFRQAHEHGDRLVVVLARDVTVERVKGRLPFRKEAERLCDVKNEPLVDEVILGDTGDVRIPLHTARPDVICLGYDQSVFTEVLRENEFAHIRVVRLKAFRPDEYKSSKVAKRVMRGRILTTLRGMCPEVRKKISEQLLKRVSRRSDVLSAQTILGYFPIVEEVDLTPLFVQWRREGRTILFPLILGSEVVPVVWEEHAVCLIGSGGFPVVDGPAKEWSGSIDVAFVPAVAIDKNGWRLGRGGGYYDRFLASCEVRTSISVVHSAQVVDRVPRERHDRKIDVIIS